MSLIRTVGRVVGMKWAAIGFGLIIAYEGYLLLKPPPPTLDEPRRVILEDAAWQAVEKLPDLSADAKVAILRLNNDRTGQITQRLREVVERAGKYLQPEQGAAQRLLDELKRELRLEEGMIGTLEQALTAGRRLDVPFVVFGNVEEFTSDQQSARLRMELTVADVIAEAPADDPVLVAIPEPQPLVADGSAATTSSGAGVGSRLLIWLGAVGLLPLVTFPFIRSVLNRESNAATGAALLAYALAGWILAYGMAGFEVAGLLMAAVLIAAFAVSLVWNYLIFTHIENSRV